MGEAFVISFVIMMILWAIYSVFQIIYFVILYPNIIVQGLALSIILITFSLFLFTVDSDKRKYLIKPNHFLYNLTNRHSVKIILIIMLFFISVFGFSQTEITSYTDCDNQVWCLKSKFGRRSPYYLSQPIAIWSGLFASIAAAYLIKAKRGK